MLQVVNQEHTEQYIISTFHISELYLHDIIINHTFFVSDDNRIAEHTLDVDKYLNIDNHILYLQTVENSITYCIKGYDCKSKTEVILGRYVNLLVAQQIYSSMVNQQFTQFRGGPYYNIYEMPYDYSNYTII